MSFERRPTMTIIKSVTALEEEEMEELYTWIDSIPLSRPKRNIARDFSDGVLAAEVVKHLFPKFVDIHNYSTSNSVQTKMQNWMHLNRIVFSKHFHFELSEDILKDICKAKPGLIEPVLFLIRTRMERTLWESQNQKAMKGSENENPEADQYLPLISPRKNGKKAAGKGFKPSKTAQDEVVPLILLEEKEQEVLAKNETIQILQAKIKRLEHLLHLKDIRIEDMQQRLEATRPTGKR